MRIINATPKVRPKYGGQKFRRKLKSDQYESRPCPLIVNSPRLRLHLAQPPIYEQISAANDTRGTRRAGDKGDSLILFTSPSVHARAINEKRVMEKNDASAGKRVGP